jgi:FkbM family methyltransferase
MQNYFIEKILPWLFSSNEKCACDLDVSDGLYIYGAGDLGALALEYCEACDIQIKGFLDRARTEPMASKLVGKYRVYRPDSVENALDKNIPVAVAIATSPYAPIAEQLHALNWQSVTPFYNLSSSPQIGHPLRNGWCLGEVSDYEKKMVQFVCDHWADETSWLHYEAFIAWHRNNTEIELNLAPITPSERYAFPKLLKALQDRQRVFVDVGSHHGESIARMNLMGIGFREYHSFEPDPASRSVLQIRKKALVPSDATFVVYADVLSDKIGSSNFQVGLGYCSQIWKNGAESRQTNVLDTFNLNPNFLKIHTEGSEAKIIKGALETIERSKPVIAYSVYHRREGFFSDIAEAMALISGYQWFFRLHSFQGTGAFVYAIPN